MADYIALLRVLALTGEVRLFNSFRFRLHVLECHFVDALDLGGRPFVTRLATSADNRTLKHLKSGA